MEYCFKNIFNSLKSDKNRAKKFKTADKNDRVENRRKLYEFAIEEPAEIVVGKPYDLNPSSYEDTKMIIRNESIKAGISKYGSGERSWIAMVCDDSHLSFS